MQISIAICTWNRAASLAITLETLHAACRATRSVSEVLIVNNNSTDSTDAVIESYAAKLPIRRVFEPRPGISYARNAAIEAAVGDYVVWTDDDVLVDRGWVSAYVAAFRAHPDAGLFGGAIIPLFEGETPRWLASAWNSVGTAYGFRDFGQRPLPLHRDRLPYGANFAVRRHELNSVRCNPRLGRRPGNYWLVGEETQLFAKLLAQGVQGWWVPAAKVRHRIPPHRQTVGYLRQYFIGCGKTEMLLWDQPPNRLIHWGRRLRLCRDWVKAELRHRWLRTTHGPDLWVPALAEVSLAWGRLRASRRADASR